MENSKTLMKKLLVLTVIAVFTNFVSTAAVKIQNSSGEDPIEELDVVNPTFERLVSKINEGFIFNAQISSSTVKKDGNVEMAFSSFGEGPLQHDKDGSLRITQVSTSFNDRNNFQGKKTLESVTLSESGGKIHVSMQFHTWAQQRVTLSNATITKERFGYFITGSQSNGTKSVYYTITIHHLGRLI